MRIYHTYIRIVVSCNTMPMPWTYRQATREWQAFLGEAKTAMNLESDNATYTAVEGVLKAFRRRLTPQQAVDFAQVLPGRRTPAPRHPCRLGGRGQGAAPQPQPDAAELRRGDSVGATEIRPAWGPRSGAHRPARLRRRFLVDPWHRPWDPWPKYRLRFRFPKPWSPPSLQ